MDIVQTHQNKPQTTEKQERQDIPRTMHMDTLELHDQITTKMENTLLGSRSLNETAEAISSHDLFLQLQHQFTRDSNCLSDCSDGYKTPLSLLLLDLRPEEDYEDTRIKQAIHLIFPPMWIKRLKKKIVNNFANFQFWGHNDEDKTKFEHWRSSQDQKCIVVFDMSMKKDSDAFVFVDALYQGMALELSKDQEPVRVCYVAGGFESLLQFKAFHIYFEKPGQSPLSPQQPLGSVQPKKRFSKMNLRVTQSNDVPPSALPDSKPFFGQKIVTKLAPQEDDDEDVQSANDNAAPAHPYSVITKNIYVGSSDIPNGPNPVEELSKLGVTHVLNLAAEVPLDEKVVESGRFQARWIPVYDNTEQDLEKPLEDAIEFIDHAIRNDPQAIVFVHCKAGRSRSVSVVLGYLVQKQKYTLHSAYKHVRKIRRGVSPNLGFMASLLKVELETHGVNTSLY